MKHLAGAVAVVILMAGSTQAATALDAINWPDQLPWTLFGFGLVPDALSTTDGTTGALINAEIKTTATPEPATMILLGAGLLAAFRARRHHQQA